MTQPNLSLRCCWTMIRRVKHCLAHGQKRHTWPVEWNHGISIRPLSQGSSLPKLEVEECPRLPRNVQKLNVGMEDGILDAAVYWITLISCDYDSATKICCDPKVQQLSSTKLQTCHPTSKWIHVHPLMTCRQIRRTAGVTVVVQGRQQVWPLAMLQCNVIFKLRRSATGSFTWNVLGQCWLYCAKWFWQPHLRKRHVWCK